MADLHLLQTAPARHRSPATDQNSSTDGNVMARRSWIFRARSLSRAYALTGYHLIIRNDRPSDHIGGVPQRGTACVNMILKRLTGERPSTVLAWRRVAEGNCVAVRRGGEQPKANLSSQSSQTRRLNPIRLVGMASLRRKGEALALSLPEAITKHDHTIAKDSDGVWDEKAGKAEQLSVEILLGATESGEEVRALIVALKRVTTVEPRGVGR